LIVLAAQKGIAADAAALLLSGQALLIRCVLAFRTLVD
jgi:hypothetical protein